MHTSTSRACCRRCRPGIIVVVDAKASIFTRIWCLYEMFMTGTGYDYMVRRREDRDALTCGAYGVFNDCCCGRGVPSVLVLLLSMATAVATWCCGCLGTLACCIWNCIESHGRESGSIVRDDDEMYEKMAFPHPDIFHINIAGLDRMAEYDIQAISVEDAQATVQADLERIREDFMRSWVPLSSAFDGVWGTYAVDAFIRASLTCYRRHGKTFGRVALAGSAMDAAGVPRRRPARGLGVGAQGHIGRVAPERLQPPAQEPEPHKGA
ncbi:hypothetical protein HYH03_003147 [Edaphochlamys debaryana]|uniref:Uncharacterized protein n=1 Tax=Edaphochlamys debaryana TaxID=47281 RepID=A0A836C4P4_9CHLO|nr:hypothetical protein HYH03_003147 [Edaphochlamys debaryana]|eukprot:KAG2498957.1 hypothetical protein HYH03_003147 [Edaphochlamys debaryana]